MVFERRIETEVVVESSENVAVMDGRGSDLGRGLVGGTDDLANVHAAASHDAHCRLGPMIAPSLGFHLGSATELTPSENGNVVEHTSYLKVGD
jgi:hypothetical protein